MSTEVDVIVLGLGTSGEDLALQLLDAGLEVAGIEASLVGGECPYWACIPTKMMVRAGNLIRAAREVNEFAGRAEVEPDWKPVAARIRAEATGDWDDSIAVQRFKDRGGLFLRGRGHLAGPRTVVVDGVTVTAQRGVVLATGSQPAIPPIPGLADVDYWTTHDVVKLETLPTSLAVMGGGAVGCEIGQVLARFDVDITIVEANERLLSQEEPEVSALLGEVFGSEGITVMTGATVDRVTETDGQIELSLADGATVSAEKLLVATGRTVDLSDLGLESVEIDDTGRHVPVDERLRAAEGIWAMGDITGAPKFTHIAVYQARIVAADILGRDVWPADYTKFPRATFTDPEIGSVGMTEASAREAGVDVEVTVKAVPATFRGWVHGSGSEGLVKLVIDREAGVLVGATAMGPSGGEVLGLLTAAVHERIPLENLRNSIYAFPTFQGAVGEALGGFAAGVTTVLDPDYEPVLTS